MADDPGFVVARGSLDSDANVMFFMSPALLKAASQGDDQASKVADAVGWVSLGVAVRDTGISLTAHGSMDPSRFDALRAFADLKPLRPDLYKILPSGPYGAVAIAQEGTFIDFAMTTAEQLGAQDGVAKFRKDFADGTGLDFKNDLVASLQGNTVVAFYPSEGVDVGGVDLLAVVDDSNGANPARVAQALREFLDKSYREHEKKGPLMVKVDDPDGSAWILAPNVEKDLQKSLADTFSSRDIKGNLLYDGKTVVTTTRGNAVLASTSRKLLQRAVASYTTGADNVAGEALLAQPNLVDDAQSMMVFNLAKIAKGVEATLNIDQMDKEPADTIRGILKMFAALDTPLTAKWKLSPNTMGVSVFIPLDYDALIDFIGAQVKQSHASSGQVSTPVPTVPALK